MPLENNSKEKKNKVKEAGKRKEEKRGVRNTLALKKLHALKCFLNWRI